VRCFGGCAPQLLGGELRAHLGELHLPCGLKTHCAVFQAVVLRCIVTVLLQRVRPTALRYVEY
jgi:hypothetical protein